MASLDNMKDVADFAYVNDTLGDLDMLNSKENVNPLVYKLVRVQGDGTLVPATEDEVEHLLASECYQKSPKALKKHTSSEESPSIDSFVEDGDVTGLSEPEDAKEEKRKLLAKREFIEAMLQRVHEEERLRLKSEIDGSSRYRLSNIIRNKINWNYSRCSPDSVSHVFSADAPSQESPSPGNSGSIDEHTAGELEKISEGSPLPLLDVVEKPDPVTIKQDLCLDNLSIRELHEEFRRTFGRETSVKDKQWLKRRISMGLHNTPDVTNNILVENKNPSLQKLEKHFVIDSSFDDQYLQPIRTKFSTSCVPESHGVKQPFGNNGAIVDVKERQSFGSESDDDEFSPHYIRSGKRLQKPKVEYKYEEGLNMDSTAGKTYRVRKSDYEHEEVCEEEKVAVKRVRNPLIEYSEYDESGHSQKIARKRIRKPTRRYIEELSEEEPKPLGVRITSSVRDSGNNYSPTKSLGEPSYFSGVDGMGLSNRHDSLEASATQAPFVPRMRRGRPRKNFPALMKFNPSGMAAKLVKKALSVRAARYAGDEVDVKWKSHDPDGSFEQMQVDEETQPEEIQPEESSLLPVTEGSISDPLDYDIDEDNSDDYIATVPTAKGGTRRKHHRAWTLGEVMKLVEGVSRCGAGRWSEIKRLAFSTHGHRTSVDLKDKWRNLLRASYAQLQSNKEGKTQRKHASVPIPTNILMRVRELAAMQSRALGTTNSNSVSRSGRTVHKKQPV